jgi:hypothetical protein
MAKIYETGVPTAEQWHAIYEAGVPTAEQW